MSMSTDASASTSQPKLPPPPRKSSTSPPFADNVVRPFTSQGGTFGGSLQPLSYAYAPARASMDHPSAERDSPVDPKGGPYMSASARTSYTRVDVDSLPTPEYPPLPPLPTAFAVQDVPVPADATPVPAVTAATASPSMAPAPAPTPDAPTGGTQPCIAEPPIPQTPQVALTFLLVSGCRKTQLFEPETTVGRVKELVWNAWPARDADWQDERPPAPSYLRVLYLGKILQDDDTLLRIGFAASLPSPSMAPTIVHLSIRPYALPSDDPALSKKRRLSVAITRRLSSAGVAVGVVGGRGDEHDDGEVGRSGCCTGCTIC